MSVSSSCRHDDVKDIYFFLLYVQGVFFTVRQGDYLFEIYYIAFFLLPIQSSGPADWMTTVIKIVVMRFLIE